VLSKLGIDVTNVDPGQGVPTRWTVGPRSMARLNQAFGTTVELRSCRLQDANLPDSYFDRVFSISVLEHVPEAELSTMMGHVARVLKPGGMFVCTVDLFLDVEPFAPHSSNRFGRNVDIRALVEASGLELQAGVPADLLGFPEFSSKAVETRLPDLLVGTKYPVLVQAFVLCKNVSR
jgi:hypothetical protein